MRTGVIGEAGRKYETGPCPFGTADCTTSVLNYEVCRPRPRRGECGCENQCRKDEDDGSIEHLGIRVLYRML